MDESRRLYRSETDRMIAGVSGGLGEFFGVDPTLVRVAFLVLALMGGAGLPIYLGMWIVVPSASRAGAAGRGSAGLDTAGDAATEMRDVVQKGAEQARGAYDRWRQDRDAGAGTTGGGPTTPPPPAAGGPEAPTPPQGGPTAPPPPPVDDTDAGSTPPEER